MDADLAATLMEEFAVRTGIASKESPTRYLWTDAFAVCNFLELARLTDDRRYKHLALQLVDQAHHTLGRHRDDDEREGWLSGLSGEEAKAHPTRGGLRIGKPLPERGPDEPFNQRLEWERDGQYFHYLTKWMHALDLMTRATEEPRYNLWARELAEVAVDRFTYAEPGTKPRMYWKMSIDLSRPQVASMGHHDPLDGYITCHQLLARAERWQESSEKTDLSDELALLEKMVEDRDWTTADPLGLGGLLMDAQRLTTLVDAGHTKLEGLLGDVIDAAGRGLGRYAASKPLSQAAGRRLAFRELGLAIGLYGVEQGQFADRLVDGHRGMRDEILAFWKDPAHRDGPNWLDHRDINDVMLATALVPQGCML